MNRQPSRRDGARVLRSLTAWLLAALLTACELEGGAPGHDAQDAWTWDGRDDVHGWDVPPDVSDWPERAAAIRTEVRAVLEPFEPAAPEPSVVGEEVLAEGLRRTSIEFTTFDGERATAVLMRPDDDLPRPGLLLIHGHDVGAEHMTTDVRTYVRSLGLELARAGFVTLSPDVRSFGNFRPFGMGHWLNDGYVAYVKRQGDVYLRIAVNDARVALHLLRETEGVDPGRIGMAGISLGSLITLVTTAAEGDVDAVVMAGLFLPFDILFDPKHHECQHLPPLADVATADELAATLLLGQVQVHWGELDEFYVRDHGDLLVAALQERAAELGCAGHVELYITEGENHAFDPPAQAAFFRRVLDLPAGTPVLPPLDPRTARPF